MCPPSIYSVDWVENLCTQGPEPLRWIGPSLPLLAWVLRHQVVRVCPSPEADPHEECFRTPPADLEKTGMRGQTCFSGVVPTGTTVLCTKRIREH